MQEIRIKNASIHTHTLQKNLKKVCACVRTNMKERESVIEKYGEVGKDIIL